MQPLCRNLCIHENKKRAQFRKHYLNKELYENNLPAVPRRCIECEYSLITTEVRCYCCGSTYRTRPAGFSRRATIAVILTRVREQRHG